MSKRLCVTLTILIASLALGTVLWAYDGSPLPAQQMDQKQDHGPKLKKAPSARARAARTQALLVEEVRHQLVTLPFYDVFDWLEGEVTPEGTVTLRGDVVRPVTKSDAEVRVRRIEGVIHLVNKIEILPLSPNDDQLRIAIYRAIYKFDSPLFRYAIRAVPPIHIIVNHGHVTLKGVVATAMDSQLAFMAANGVSGVFEVKNELRVEEAVEKAKK